MTHVVHLSSVHYPFDPRIFHKQLRTLATEGYRATLLVHHGESTVRNGVHVRSLGDVETRLERWRNLPHLFRVARRQDADVYHLHDPELLPVGVALAATTDAEVVYDIHEDYTDAIRVREWIPEPLKPILQTAFPAVQSALTRPLDLVVTADESTREKVADRTSTPVETVRNLPKVGEIDTEGADLERSHEYVLAYVGGLDRERGLLNMLTVTSRLRDRGLDVGLWLLGPFQDDEIERRAREFMTSEEISDHVRLFGYVDYDEIFSHLSQADVGLLLVDEDRFERNVPTKFFEYLYCGLPVVLTDVASLEPYADDDYCVTVSEDNLDRIVAETARLLEETEIRAEMSDAAHETVVSEYSWEVERERLVRAYERLLATGTDGN
ncbi:glycosyltransferase [Natronorubrum daqingense]|uniref:Glycosyltransferase n=1 Tax=Natronorubrum daqingense TaxID=588898 RepID=A0A1N7FLX2_9EURY|nr:glycosyltransferase [Natronorubrum daqingense]APX98388.1 glycosyltransferase [Natronorubrum daqingense]SIS01398.1 Glycosyltransferase involved in cell wall bisynthesis [Natronorubrum daqingense]